MIYLISGNPEKEIEVKAILGKKNVDRLDIDLPEIQEIDPHKIIQAKLESAKKHHDGEFIVEDTSLYLEAFDYKLPGPLIKWFLNTIGIEGLAEIVEKSGKESNPVHSNQAQFSGAT
jgi:inosine/xanthosine triphosphate pyrophosphatase family protein